MRFKSVVRFIKDDTWFADGVTFKCNPELNKTITRKLQRAAAQNLTIELWIRDSDLELLSIRHEEYHNDTFYGSVYYKEMQ